MLVSCCPFLSHTCDKIAYYLNHAGGFQLDSICLPINFSLIFKIKFFPFCTILFATLEKHEFCPKIPKDSSALISRIWKNAWVPWSWISNIGVNNTVFLLLLYKCAFQNGFTKKQLVYPKKLTMFRNIIYLEINSM